MQKLNDLSRSLSPLDPNGTLIAVIEMSQSSWLVAGIVPGIERHPLKKLEPNEGELLRLLMRWRAEATKMGCTITRFAVAFEAGRDGFWLARSLRARDLEACVIHPTSVAVSREHRRAKTDRLDTGLLKRVFIGWLRGEPDHCHMAAIPTLAEEDAKRPNREREGLVSERTRIVNRMKSCLARFGERARCSHEVTADIFAFLTCEPNAEVGRVHPKAMPVSRPELEGVAIGLLERLIPTPKAIRLLGVSISTLQTDVASDATQLKLEF